MPNLRLAGILPNTFANGKGVRKAFFAQGCKHQCKNCFNQHTWPFNEGRLFDCDELIQDTIDETYLTGLTFTGGDPFEQPEGFAYIAKKLNHLYNIWAYTGYTFEQLIAKKDNFTNELLANIDVLVDGKFVQELADESLQFKGSSNQRIIDVKKSLSNQKIILFDI